MESVGVTEIAALVALIVVVLLAVVAVLLVARRVRLLRRGGVQVALRTARDASDTRGWRSGIGRYRSDEFRWYRVSGLGGRANVVLDRTQLEIVDRRGPVAGEMHAPGTTVLSCRTAGGAWELAVSPDVLTGFSSWLESIPPGRSTGYRQAS